ncbi:MAG: type IX secretion system sortase PorU [Bacteroidales bacterium]
MKRSSRIASSFYLILLFCFGCQLSFAVTYPNDSLEFNIEWNKENSKWTFENANGYFTKSIPIKSEANNFSVKFNVISTEKISKKEVSPEVINNILGKKFFFNSSTSRSRDISILDISVFPYALSDNKDSINILKDFSINYFPLEEPESTKKSTLAWPTKSVLNDGDIYKIAISESGIYKVTGDDLKNLGIDINQIDASKIKLYGLSGGLLPEANNKLKYTDLQEVPLKISKNEGSFNSSDYFLFYGEGPDKIIFDNSRELFTHEYNYLDNQTYYFIKISNTKGKRLSNAENNNEAPTTTTSKFLDYHYTQDAKYNLIGSGRQYFSEKLDYSNKTIDYNFDLNNRVIEDPMDVVIRIAGTQDGDYFSVKLNDNFLANITSSAKPPKAKGYIIRKNTKSNTPSANINIKFSPSTSNAKGYIQSVAINSYRSLKYSNQQDIFSYPFKIAENNITEYQFTDNSSFNVWSITDPFDTKNINLQIKDGIKYFRYPNKDVEKFIMFQDKDVKTVNLHGKINNQNLHGVRDIDYLMIVYPDFYNEAERLANFHKTHSGLKIYVTTPQEIYNEFSSGRKDISAIRNFCRMLYTSSQEKGKFKYLLLFGDASYDTRNVMGDNQDLIPTWEDPSFDTLDLVENIATDDFYGLLDENEGGSIFSGSLDIGIGRFPVLNLTQAKNAVDKVIRYITYSDNNAGEWKNNVTLVCDDRQANMHLNDAQRVARVIENKHQRFNIQKIYLNTFNLEATPNGMRSPETNKALNMAIEKGTTIVNYSGHGGEVGWSERRILEVSDIQSWNNKYKMPIFITATCEFCRFDDPKRVSAGELVFLNPNGGAAALFTTIRATFNGSNSQLNTTVIDSLLHGNKNTSMGIGMILSIGKNTSGAGTNNSRRFLLIGDPAMKFSYPDKVAKINTINGKDISITESSDKETVLQNDTIKALSKINLTGEISDGDQIDPNFNGEIFVKVYDKPSKIITSSENDNVATTIYTQNSYIYHGKSVVKDGKFSLSFVTPKDIDYNFGNGKISLYAKSENQDATGYNNDIVVGGFNDNFEDESDGPTVELFMNDKSFKHGGITNENPIFFAEVSDKNGINATGTGIGHDISAIIDGKIEKPITLNSYYQTKLNSFREGIIEYPFKDLREGKHTIELKIWDVLNNSTTKSIEFEVKKQENIVMSNVSNFPNPVQNQTQFFFNHNQAGQPLEITIQIFDISGRLIDKIQKDIITEGFSTPVITWNTSESSNSTLLSNGVYIYKVEAKNKNNGKVTSGQNKLIIAH